ncbi:MAG: calcium-binding protein, partial [Allosphingosinicella sp.]
MAGTGDYDFATLEASGVADVAYSPNESLLYAAMRNGDVNVYNVFTRQKIATWHVGTQLGGISVSADGSYLLVVERQPMADYSTFYKVGTANGSKLMISNIATGNAAYRDIEIVDGDTALLTGGGNNSYAASQTLYNLQTGAFSSLANSVYYSGGGTVLTEDKHLTLLAEPGISNGPLLLFDDRTDTIVAHGDNYQPGASSGFNWGSQAISEAAGLVLQFNYYNSVLVYDLSLKYLRSFQVAGQVDGMVFDPTGQFVYIYEIQSGYLSKYAVASGIRVDQFFVGTSDWHNDIGYGSQLLINADGTRITILDTDKDIGKLRIVDISGNGYFAGTSGADAFGGGKGDDTYLVNHLGDTITELQDGGDDTVETSLASYQLGANLERLTGLLATGQSLRGNELANTITGGAGNDFVSGGAGNDSVLGGAGDDLVRGDDGDDQLAGGAGNDNMRGGRGVDSFDGGSGGEAWNEEVSVYGDKVSFFEQFATQGAVADLRTGVISNDGFGNSETMVNIESL